MDESTALRFRPGIRDTGSRFLIIFLPLAVGLSAFALLLAHLDQQHQLRLLERDNQLQVALQLRTITDNFAGIVADLAYLAEQQPLQSYLRHPAPGERRVLEREYLSFATRKGIYDQVRFLDARGMERVRVNYREGDPVVVPLEELQEKARRYYFMDTFRLPPGRVYLSPFDLNIEQGQIEQPLKPMLRFGTVVVDPEGEKRGVVILNYLGADLILKLQEAGSVGQGRAMLLNRDGYWLSGPRPEECWGFMFPEGKGRTFGRAHPAAWEIISPGDRGQFHNDDGLFTFATVHPLGRGQISSTGSDRAFAPSTAPLEGGEYYWKIVSHLPADRLSLVARHRSGNFLLFFGVMLALLAAASWGLARSRLRGEMAEEALREREERFRTLTATATDAILLVDHRGCIGYWNRAAETIFGHAPAAALGAEACGLIAPGDQREACRRALAPEGGREGGGPVVELEGQRRDGSRFPMELSLSTMVLGGMPWSTAIIRDVTERKGIEGRLRHSQASLARAQEIAHLGNWSWEPASGRWSWSEELYRIFGHSPGGCPCTTESFLQAVHPRERSRVAAALEEVGGDPQRVLDLQYRILRPDGVERVVQLLAEWVRDGGGRPLQVTGTCQDVTVGQEARDRQLRVLNFLKAVNRLQELLLAPGESRTKLGRIAQSAVEVFDLDFCRIWVIRPGDRCQTGCPHAKADYFHCRHQRRCLHLTTSAGRYTHIDGGHARVPVGAFKIGRIASGEELRFLTNDVVHDPRVHDHQWARELGLVSFAGYRLQDREGHCIGVLALFARHLLGDDEDTLLQGLGHSASQVIMAGEIQEELARSKELFQTVTEFSNEWVYWRSADTSFFHYISPHCLTVTGYPPEEFRADPALLDRIIHPDDRERWEAHVHATDAQGSFLPQEFRIVARDGKVHWINHFCRKVVGGNGENLGRRGTNEEITERKEAEEALRESELRFRTLLDGAADPIFVHDPEGRLVDVNRRACAVLGYTKEELLGMTVSQIDPIHPPRTLRERLARLRPGEPLTLQSEYQRQDGTRFPVEITTVQVEIGGWPHALSIVRDVTERLEAEAQLHSARERAEAANRAKSEFLAAMSHEIRTPMNVVIGMSDVLLATPLEAEQRRYLELLQQAGDGLLELINDILDLSKIEAGHFQLHSAPFDLHQLAGTTVELLGVRSREKGVPLGLELGEGVPARVLGDRARLRQVLVNLIGNAIKFTEQGRITLALEPGAREGEVRFGVADTGMGIPPERLGEIFERFTQGDPTIALSHGGTGLGLAISRRLVALMGGNVEVESVPGVGSLFRFTIRLPLVAVESGEDTALPSEVPSPSPAGDDGGRGLRILLVEDFADNRILIQTYLRGSPHHLEMAEDGARAVAMARENAYDLILMDIQMPVLDGHAATRRIRQAEGEAGRAPVPIIALTAHAMEGDAARSLEAGCDGHLVKPIKKRALLAAIGEVAAGRVPRPT